ncbi:MAG: GtrA family protein [Actinomycetia bacterium]|nr:GtrA family protein [Actinomycetes bacterium]
MTDRLAQLPAWTQPAVRRARILAAPFHKLITEFSKFGIVGLIALVIDIGLFNLLMYAGPGGFFADRPITAKVVSVVVATTASYFLNRAWTFSDRARTGVVREYVLFFVLNGIALLIALGVLWFSHYALGLTSALADNISANVVGLALGTLFRFWAYRKWVFPEVDPLDQVGEIDIPEPATALHITGQATGVGAARANELKSDFTSHPPSPDPESLDGILLGDGVGAHDPESANRSRR